MDGVLLALIAAALLIGGLLIVFIQVTSHHHTTLDIATYQKVWRGIAHGVDTRSPESMQMAIIKADKLVDRALRESGVAGQTMGDRLKARRGRWQDENGLWAAHKLRNQIAHETDVHLTRSTFKRAMSGFERALKDLGAL